MLETPRRWLAELRAGADPQRFAFHAAPDSHDPDGTCCANAEARAQLLLALQYDHHERDAPLLRLLLDAETAAHAHADFQGLEEELHLAAWLVPADVFRMSAAKFANFDTGCGFDGEHLVAAGVAVTLAYLHASDDPRCADIFEYLADTKSECQFDEAHIADWHAAKARWFPARETDETPLTMLERALRFAPAQAAGSRSRSPATAARSNAPTHCSPPASGTVMITSSASPTAPRPSARPMHISDSPQPATRSGAGSTSSSSA